MNHLVTRAISSCPTDNSLYLEQTSFFENGSINWDAHRIGWAVCGLLALLTTITSSTNVYLHCTNYRSKLQQRQIIRIILMPIVFAVISFAGYRFFRVYVYFKLVRDTYEAFTVAAFFVLLLLYLSDSPIEQRELLSTKEKRKMIFPLCFLRTRPSKPAFLYVIKWTVLQFVIVKPLISLASVITEALGIFCATSQSPAFANLYLEIVDFISVTIALYGLVTMYSLTATEIQGRRPLSKFITIKLTVALVFYQNFIFNQLAARGVLKATTYWTAHNIADGLNSLVLCAEMFLMALFQAIYAFNYKEYKLEISNGQSTPFWSSFFHSQNYSDFFIDIASSFKFFWQFIRGVEGTRASHLAKGGNDLNFNFDSTKSPQSWKSEGGGGEYPLAPYDASASYSNVSLSNAGVGVDGGGRAFYGAGRDYQQLGGTRG